MWVVNMMELESEWWVEAAGKEGVAVGGREVNCDHRT